MQREKVSLLTRICEHIVARGLYRERLERNRQFWESEETLRAEAEQRRIVRRSRESLQSPVRRARRSRFLLPPRLSQLQPFPPKLIGPLCVATGSNLIRQFFDMQAAMSPATTDAATRLAAEWSRAA